MGIKGIWLSMLLGKTLSYVTQFYLFYNIVDFDSKKLEALQRVRFARDISNSSNNMYDYDKTSHMIKKKPEKELNDLSYRSSYKISLIDKKTEKFSRVYNDSDDFFKN